MKAPLSILGTASQASGSTPLAETFYFSSFGTDYENLGDWFMDDGLSIPASRIPASDDDVVINRISNDYPSFGERTYKSIVFTPSVNCWDSGISDFFKSAVKFYTSTGSITGAPTSLIADLESVGDITLTNGVSLDIVAHKLAGNWVASGSIVLGDYYHGDEPDNTPSQIACSNYTLVGCLDFVGAFPGNSSTPGIVSITQNAGGVSNPNSYTFSRCIQLDFTAHLAGAQSISLCPDSADSISTVNIHCDDQYGLGGIAGTVGAINVYSGVGDECYAATNFNLFGSASIGYIELTGNLSYETEAQYITARQNGNTAIVVGQIYISGYEHQKFTLTGGPVGVLDILVYDGAGYNLYTVGDNFSHHGRLNYTGSWDLSFNASFDVGSWATGSPPSLSDWTSATSSTEPTWGTE